MDISYMWCCTTVERWYVDRLRKLTLSYSNASLFFDCIFLVIALVDELYVHGEHSMGDVNELHTPTLRVNYFSYFEVGFQKQKKRLLQAAQLLA